MSARVSIRVLARHEFYEFITRNSVSKKIFFSPKNCKFFFYKSAVVVG